MSLCRWSYTQAWYSTVSAIVASGKPLRVFGAYVLNGNGVANYLQLFNRSAALAGNEVPGLNDMQFAIPASGGEIIADAFFGADGQPFPLGLVWGVSTTRGSYVASTAANLDVMLVVGNGGQ